MQYPEIERRDGTLFFAVSEFDRVAIATSIERLIDMLDAMGPDPDLEETGDEHDTGMPEGWKATGEWWRHETGYFGDVHEDDEDGHDAEEDRCDYEPALGWTNHIDQTVAAAVHVDGMQPTGEDEPDLGWTGSGTGWTYNDGHDDTENNGDESDYSGYVGDPDRTMISSFTGSGQKIAAEMLRSIGRTMSEPEPGSMFLRIVRQ